MIKKKASKLSDSNTIALNRRARFEYLIEQKLEAGLVLTGWEVKSLRQGRGHLTDTYVSFKNGEAFLLGAHITPLNTVSTHTIADPLRTRKLLLNKREILRLFSATQQQGYTCIALSLYWKGHRIKCQIALAKGKKIYDRRATAKERDWNRHKQRVLKAR